MHARTDEVLSHSRWKDLGAFVTQWYAEPLGVTDAALELVDRAEQRIGRPLPGALREWYWLVATRLQFVGQDMPVSVEHLALDARRICVWRENQGCWSYQVEVDTGDDDPWTAVESKDPKLRGRDRLSRRLFASVVSDTLIGAWHIGEGPL